MIRLAAVVGVAAVVVWRAVSYRRALVTNSAGTDLQSLWKSCVSGFNTAPNTVAYAYALGEGVDERRAHPLPAVFKDAVFFSLTGFNPHGEVVDAVDNEQANVRLLAAVQQLRRRPRDVVRAFGHDPSHTWLERGMSLVYPAAAVRGDADIQSDVLALALRFRQSGVFRYDVEDNGVVVVQTMLPTAPRFDALRSVVRVAFGEPAARHAALASSEWSYVFKSARQCADVLLKHMDGVASRHPEVAASLSTLRSTVESVAASASSSSASSSPHRGAVLVALESSLPTTTVVTGWSAAAVAQGLSRGLDGTPETVVTPAEALLSARGFTAAVVAAMDVEVAPLRIASRMLMGYIVVDAARSLPPHHVVVVDGLWASVAARAVADAVWNDVDMLPAAGDALYEWPSDLAHPHISLRLDSRALPERCGRDALRHINAECSCTALVVSAPDDGSSEDVSGVCADKLLPVLQSLLRSP